MQSTGERQDQAVGPRQRARIHLLETAERLFALQGTENVSLRQIAGAAGYSNLAIVQYYFGSKEGLCEAIVAHRLPAIDARWFELVDEASPDDLRGLVEIMVRPLLEHDPDSYYIGFVARTFATLDGYERAYYLANQMEGGRRLRAAIDRIQGDAPPAVRRMRFRFATALMVNAIAERHARATSGLRQDMNDKDFARELYIALTAVLRPVGHS